MTESNTMTKSERAELVRLVKLRAKVAADDIDSHAARVRANIEAQLAATYPEDHAAWVDVTAHLERAVAEADTKVAQCCRELGIPDRFRPRVYNLWFDRGENALKDRQAELRRVAQTELAARVKAAKNTIDRRTADLLTQLAVGALESVQARDFLNAMPSVDDLIPQITLDNLKAIAFYEEGKP